MSTTILFAQWLHIIGATVLIGTGAGIAFFMLMAHRTGDAKLVARPFDRMADSDPLDRLVTNPLCFHWLVLAPSRLDPDSLAKSGKDRRTRRNGVTSTILSALQDLVCSGHTGLFGYPGHCLVDARQKHFLILRDDQ